MAVVPERIKAIFFAAMAKTEPSERASYLDEVCAGDAALREHVDALLEAHGRADSLLDRAAVVYLAAEQGEQNAVENLDRTAVDDEIPLTVVPTLRLQGWPVLTYLYEALYEALCAHRKRLPIPKLLSAD